MYDNFEILKREIQGSLVKAYKYRLENGLEIVRKYYAKISYNIQEILYKKIAVKIIETKFDWWTSFADENCLKITNTLLGNFFIKYFLTSRLSYAPNKLNWIFRLNISKMSYNIPEIFCEFSVLCGKRHNIINNNIYMKI